MRFQLILQSVPGQFIPINYQYELGSWIYKVIAQADAEYASFLHGEGYTPAATSGAAQELQQTRRYKLFCFSQLHIPRREVIKDRIQILGPEIRLQVSFRVGPAAEHFMAGLFQDQRFRLGDKLTQADLTVKRVEAQPVVVDLPELVLQTRSPIVLSRAREQGPAEYLSPDDPEYGPRLIENLRQKYLSCLPSAVAANLISETHDEAPVGSFEVIGRPPKSRLVTLRAHKEEATRVRGYHFRFRLKAPIELLETGLDAGFGGKNSMGFGFGEVV